jgi:hypothetical protein
MNSVPPLARNGWVHGFRVGQSPAGVGFGVGDELPVGVGVGWPEGVGPGPIVPNGSGATADEVLVALHAAASASAPSPHARWRARNTDVAGAAIVPVWVLMRTARACRREERAALRRKT